MDTRSGDSTSLQPGNFGDITNLNNEDFEIPGGVPFQVKNEGATDVWLDVIPSSGSEFVPTLFYVGWNPEIVKAVKKNANALNLKWGY